MTYYWPTVTEAGISESYGGFTFRGLLAFRSLHSLVPANANITLARLNLTFANWDGANRTVQICALKTAWSGLAPGMPYKGVGWKQTGMFVSTDKCVGFGVEGFGLVIGGGLVGLAWFGLVLVCFHWKRELPNHASTHTSHAASQIFPRQQPGPSG